MIEFIEIKYMSPISNFKFCTDNLIYYLVLTSTNNGIIYINKIKLDDFNNVTQTTRGYNIGKAIKVEKTEFPFCSVKMFSHNLNNNIISLLFSGNIDIDNIEYNGIKVIMLYKPSAILGKMRHGIYQDDSSFIDEKYYNFETVDMKNKCILFISRSIGKRQLIMPSIYTIDNYQCNDIFIYDRYNTNIIKETPVCVNFIMKRNYLDLIEWYNIDVNRYDVINTDNFEELVMRKINVDNFRQQKIAPYLNGLICSPADGRTKILNNNSFVTRMTWSDYPYVLMPYLGVIIDKKNGMLNNGNHYVILKFINDYYIPPSVQEREYISVLLGHPIFNSKLYPELLIPQPKTTLAFSIILIGNNNPNSISTIPYIQNSSIPQGIEVARFNLCCGTIYCVFNRNIDMSRDMLQYSEKQIECYIRVRDIIGVLL